MRLKVSCSMARAGTVAVLSLLSFGGASIAQTQQPKMPAAAPTAAPATAAQGGAQPAGPTWMVNCTNVTGGFDCRASQTLFAVRTRQRILTLAVQITPNAKKPVMMIQGPLSIYLPAGITVQIGKEAAMVLPVQSCDQGGCLTEYAPSNAEIEAMRKGADLTVTVQDLKKTPIKLTVPGLGFAEAYAKLR